jgi:DNA-dependent RNA polymerase auxiliary subunit epsilon
MKYKVTFTQRLTQNETNEVIVEASSEKEARRKVTDIEYDTISVTDAKVIKVENFNITKVEELVENGAEVNVASD